MNTPNDGGPAFPFGQISERTGQPINWYFSEGMTIRDYFAAAALTGIISNANNMEYYGKDASLAYDTADAMLAARERKESE